LTQANKKLTERNEELEKVSGEAPTEAPVDS